MRFGARVRGWFRRAKGIQAAHFISVDEVRQANAGVGLGKVGQGLDANVVMAPVQFIQRTFTQSVPVVEERAEFRKWDYVPDHELELLLANPNPFYDGDTLTKAFLLSWFLDGNAYVRKVRSTLRAVVRLWFVPHWQMRPRWDFTGRGPFITHYEWTPSDGGAPEDLAVEDVIHLRVGLDPRDPRLGLSPIKAALREVLTDEEAATFSAFILGNMGVPGGVIAPKSTEFPPKPEDIAEMKKYMSTAFTGKNRGKWMVLGAPTEVSQFGFDPNRLMLGPLRDISEERICAMIGVPAAVVGFGAGLQQTKVGATMRELVKLARVNCIEPTQLTISRQLGRSLLPEFEPNPETFRVAYDNEGVSMFLEDETSVAKRAGALFADGVATRNEARAMVRLDPVPDGDTFKSAGAAPAPPPAEEIDDDEGGNEGDEPPPPPANRMWREWAPWGEPDPNGDDPL